MGYRLSGSEQMMSHEMFNRSVYRHGLVICVSLVSSSVLLSTTSNSKSEVEKARQVI